MMKWVILKLGQIKERRILFGEAEIIGFMKISRII